jgi:hypothetical protein
MPDMAADLVLNRVDVLDDRLTLARLLDGPLIEIDLSHLIDADDTFASIRERPIFEQAWINFDIASLEWPGGVSIDADVLYRRSDLDSGGRIDQRTLRRPDQP